MLGLLPKSLGLDLSCVHLTLMVTQLSPWSHGVLLLSGGGQSQVLPLARSGHGVGRDQVCFVLWLCTQCQLWSWPSGVQSVCYISS